MLTLKVDEEDLHNVLELQTEAGELVRVGDIFEIKPNQLSDKDGRELAAATRVKVEKISILPVLNQIEIKGILPDGEVFTGNYASFDLKSRQWIVGTHGGCGGNIIKKRQCRWCEKCGEYFCGCACG